MYTVLYGINTSTQMFLESKFNTGNNLFVCTDGGEQINGHSALSLRELAQWDYKKIERIVICSEFVSEILSSLAQINLSKEICFFFNYSAMKLTPCASLLEPEITQNNTLTAFYDLRFNLPCFDVVTFVVLAERARISKGKKFIQFVIVPDREDSKPSLHPFYSVEDARWRIEKILKAVFCCVPSFVASTELLCREQLRYFENQSEQSFPEGYLADNSVFTCDFAALKKAKDAQQELSCIVPPLTAQRLVEKYLEGKLGNKKLVTITLREYWADAKHRNSPWSTWKRFAESLDKNKYLVVLVRDFYHCTEPLAEPVEHLEQLPIAAVDLPIRLALYQKAYCNLGVENGPLYPISFIKGASSILFRFQNERVPTISTQSNDSHYMEVNNNHFFNDNPCQLNIWGACNFDSISRAFERFEMLKAAFRLQKIAREA